MNSSLVRAAATIGALAVVIVASIAVSGAADARDPAMPRVLVRDRETAAVPGDPLILAHYYIWFDPTSWNRAKVDYPLVGRYSSDDVSVMRRHIELAKQVGIDGFIVSWKSTDRLNRRLDQLVGLAEDLDFRLGITYQGLDFNRDPLPPQQVAADLDLFLERWAGSPVFDLFDRPLVVWTGTWRQSVASIASVTNGRRDQLLILASEKSAEDYERVAGVVEGNLYYWSSVNPETHPGYPRRLVEMGDAIRARGHVWIAPVAPGFDAQLLGGDRAVERSGGRTLQLSWNGALQSLPDAIGIISWNEFSENTHIEPSTRHGDETIVALAKLSGAEAPSIPDFDSSAPEGPGGGSPLVRYGALGSLASLVAGSVLVVGRRRPRRGAPSGA